MNSPRTSAIATFLVGLALLVPASLGLLISGVPTNLSPHPFLTIVPAFLISNWRLQYAAILMPVLLFLAWNRQLFRGEARIPRRSYALLASVILLSIVYFLGSWELGLKYEGVEYTQVVGLVNLGWATLLVLAFAFAWKKGSSFRTSLLLHWLLFAWLAWYAFPYLGEMP